MTHIWINKMGRHWFRFWLAACWVPSHCLSKWWMMVYYWNYDREQVSVNFESKSQDFYSQKCMTKFGLSFNVLLFKHQENFAQFLRPFSMTSPRQWWFYKILLAIKNIYIFVISREPADCLACGVRISAGAVVANLGSRIYGYQFRPGQNFRHFADDILKCIFLNENVWISHKISLKFVPKVRMNNIPALAQILAWRRPGDKLFYEPMTVSLLTHICVTRPQWVKLMRKKYNFYPVVSKYILTQQKYVVQMLFVIQRGSPTRNY